MCSRACANNVCVFHRSHGYEPDGSDIQKFHVHTHKKIKRGKKTSYKKCNAWGSSIGSHPLGLFARAREILVPCDPPANIQHRARGQQPLSAFYGYIAARLSRIYIAQLVQHRITNLAWFEIRITIWRAGERSLTAIWLTCATSNHRWFPRFIRVWQRTLERIVDFTRETRNVEQDVHFVRGASESLKYVWH